MIVWKVILVTLTFSGQNDVHILTESAQLQECEVVAENIYKEVEQNPEFFGVYAFCAEFPNKNGV
jgi:hypothetical protein|tara:strand:+ start:1296 stop:1490 length:195 start_codon:yes stop_codon:yes gene_type:complete